MKIKVEPTQFKLDNSEKSRDETTILMDQTGTNENEQDQSKELRQFNIYKIHSLQFRSGTVVNMVNFNPRIT